MKVTPSHNMYMRRHSMKYIIIAIATLALCIFAGCNKEEDNPTQPPGGSTATCSYTTDVVAVDGTTAGVLRATGHTVGNWIAEFLTDTSAVPTGVALVFGTTASPTAGDYTIDADPANVTAGEVYVEYYNATTAWHGTSGTVKVEGSGSAKVYSFCSLTLTAGGSNTRTVSLHATGN